MPATMMGRQQFIEWLRGEFPRLLQEDPRFSAEVVGILSQTLGSRAEFNRLLEEIRGLRENGDRRFEALQHEMDRRFEALQQEMDRRFVALQQEMDRRFGALQQEMDRRFGALQQEMDRRFDEANRRFETIERTLLAHTEELAEHRKILRRLETGLGSLGHRLGAGFEEAVRATVEEFSGVGPLRAERLVIRDAEGELFGVRGQAVEFDAFVHDGRRFLVEVKSFAEPEDVLNFFRKIEFARRHVQQPFEALLIAPFALKGAVQLARELGIRLLMHVDEDTPDAR